MNKLIGCFSAMILQSLAFSVTAQITSPTISPRIVGGIESDPLQWPTMVSIKYNSFEDQHFCGGSLIAPQWVVTAAHCVFDERNSIYSTHDIMATISEYDLSSSPITPASSLVQIIAHPDFNSNTLRNDIALLKLAVPVDTPVMDIADIESTISLISSASPVTAIGWGSTESYDPAHPTLPSYPNILQQVELQLYSDKQCTEQLGTPYNAEMLCASTPTGGQDSCSGDSGGPLLVETNLGWQQLGIVSWGYGCALANAPGVYTRIALYKDWIKTITSTFSVTAKESFITDSADTSVHQQIIVSNNSDSVAAFNYELNGSEYFSFDASLCQTIEANSTCPLIVTYAPLEPGTHKAIISINADIEGSTTANSQLSGTFLVEDSDNGSSSGSTGIMILLLIPLVFIRRYLSQTNIS